LLLFWIAPALAAGDGLYHDPPNSKSILLLDEGNRVQDLRGAPLAIPLTQSTPTTLTVEIVGSPWVAVDNDGATLSGNLPNVYLVEADVTNTGDVSATNVIITLDYNSSGEWVLLAGEDPIREVAELGVGETYHAYWFAQYPNNRTLPDPTHQYSVSAVADNADPVSESENKHDPVADQTVEAVLAQSTTNNEFVQADLNVTVGVAFTMTQEFDLGTNADNVALNPVGNDDFDPSAYRLISVEGRFLDGSTVVRTFTDEVYFTSLDALSPDKAEVTYTFLALLPQNSTICPYAAIDYTPTKKYDDRYCSDLYGTTININGAITLDLDKQVNLIDVEQGQILEYTIAYTNAGDLPLQYGWIWDDVPTDTVSIIASSISPASDPDETTTGRVAWGFDTIPVDGTGVLSFSVLVDGNGQDIADGQEIVNQAKFGISTYGLPNDAALTSTVASTVQAPAITMSKTDGQSAANPGDLLTYVIQITNSGSIPATGLVVTDELPLNVSLAGPTIPAYDVLDGQTLIWNNLAPLADNGGSLAITIPVGVDPELAEEGVLTNIGEVSYQNAAGHTFSTQTASDLTFVTVPTTTLSLSKTAEDLNGEPLVVGDTIRYTLQVTNTGAFTAYHVTITDDLPTHVSCQSISNGQPCADPLTWDVGNLGQNDVESLTIDVMIEREGAGQSIVNSASVTSTNVVTPPDPDAVCPDGSEPTGDACEITPGPNTQLLLSKTAEDLNGAPLVVGDTIRYTLQVTNTGAYTAYNVTVTDDLPAEVECQSVSDGLACADPFTWDVGTLGPNYDTATLTIDVMIIGGVGQPIVNSASVTATNVVDPTPDPEVCPDGNEPNSEGDCPETPIPGPELVLSKTAEDLDGAPLVVSDTIRYTLQVTNTGAYTAFNVTVTDDLPAEVECQSVSDGLACADPLTWDVGDLGPDITATLMITVVILPEAAGQSVVNSASVTATNVVDPPPDPLVCPDGSEPNEGVCEEPIEPLPSPGENPNVYLPIIIRAS